MRNILLLVLFAIAGENNFAQSNDSTQYIFGLPVTEDDTARAFPQRDIYPYDKKIRVQPGNLPEKLLKSLEENNIYRNWNREPVYHDRNADLFIITIRQDSVMKIFRMTREGKAVSYDERSIE